MIIIKKLGYVLLGVLVAVVFIEFRRPAELALLPLVVPAPQKNTDQQESAQSQSVPSGQDAHVDSTQKMDIVVRTQSSGLLVRIDALTVPETSWIVVRDYVDGGARGSVLGALRLMSGEYTDASVQLLRATEKGKEYAIEFFTDNGNNTFDVGSDIPRALFEPTNFLVE